MPSSPGIGMHVEVRDPEDKTILSRVYSSEGRISFTSHTPGEHIICMYSNSTKWFSGTQLVGTELNAVLNMTLIKIFFFRESILIFKLENMQLITVMSPKKKNYQNFNLG